MKKYFKVWWLMTSQSIQMFFVSRLGALLFLSGKILRFIFFFGFLLLLFSKTEALAGYDLNQVILFYFTFSLIDSATQMLFREVYRFRQYIVTGNFDMLLVKPVNPLFRSLFGWTDILDLITLGPFILMIVYVLTKIPGINFASVAIYIALLINSMILATSFHVIVLALAVMTTEIDHAILIYRDIVGMGKIPIDVYSEPLRSLITFVIPVGIMMAFPVKALLGSLKMPLIIFTFVFSLSLLFISIAFWNYSLKKYTSASS
ncbi:MAG: ABC transporter permease [Candidatus Gottesmanbacteria bacterium GW2011_GWA2_43_14]|uniref:ABC transporter permease n=1 Tax=Candidatus Gottesmanbacteria bacterium GW2011_GWA2_43_14 TaxID=1618443 RepID=A0A0G1DDT5_9BACT|nr:MAG: ABC transporter permease [Candidatus Gottesmanbacteria bacterium GW2011_GWA2_43_14]